MGDGLSSLFLLKGPSRKTNPNDPESKEFHQRQLDDLQQQVKLRAQNEEGSTAAAATAKTARDRQRRIALANQGRSSTILSGPLGLQGAGGDLRKTLLGM